MSVRLGSKADVVKTLRTLLRLNRTTTTNKKAWSDVILEKFRERQHETDRTKIKAYRAEATDFLHLWTGVEEQKRLWNMDAGIEKRMKNADIVKKSARLVGLQVPDMYTDKEENKL
ncbi:hypothetical protein H257_09156 [Aphanomyces astaci]|uniref:Uncharacterized protein n=1 Tax=Aphanomyces astaci TaxID=112090 RepID=W4GCK9_APHAT|nr:hypothetical protein H257_09156 [Aphanomyces astaci]ETV76673.1 hypothetical protein H257_09156 [Aphanomyces astaci]KAF0715184.1 hypothetical protein AaE_011388 [Aphanomyces astaci]|eukprot:XP_009833585.1 hypothetical protein H257_09156 [Aphanomyces astaci]